MMCQGAKNIQPPPKVTPVMRGRQMGAQTWVSPGLLEQRMGAHLACASQKTSQAGAGPAPSSGWERKPA